MHILALIWDFNGVLVDDERIHFSAFQKTLETEGLSLSWEEYCEKYLHFDDRNFFQNVLTDQGHPGDPGHIRELIALKSKHYFEEITVRVPAVEDSVEFVRRVPANTLMAVASAAARKEIVFILDRLGLADRFAAVVSASDVAHGKPHPETFLKAFEALREKSPELDPEQALVIEDSYRGVESAHAAGLKCLALTTSYPAERLADADLILESLKDWTVERLEERL